MFRKEDEPLSRADDCSAADSEAAAASCEARVLAGITAARGAAYRRSLEISSTHKPAALAYAFRAIGCVAAKKKILLPEDRVKSRGPGISPQKHPTLWRTSWVYRCVNVNSAYNSCLTFRLLSYP